MPKNPQLSNILGRVINLSRIKGMKLIRPLVTLIIAVAILGYLVYREKDILFSYQWQLHPELILLSFIIFSIDLFLVAFIWGWIMNTIGKKLDYTKHLRYYSISNVTKRIPGTIWYIATRAQLYKKEGIDFRLTSLASGIELAISVMSGILASLLFAIPIVLHYDLNPIILAGIFLTAGLLLHPRLFAWVLRLIKVEANLFSYKKTLQWVLAYIPAWILGGVVLFVIANSITSLSLSQLGYIIGSWSLVGVISYALFFSPSNLGLTEVGLSLLLSNIMPSSIAVVLAITARIAIIVYEILWSLIWFNFRSTSPDEIQLY